MRLQRPHAVGARRSFIAATLVATTLAGCAAWKTRAEGLEPSTLPDEVRADYAVFAQRCSKCHSIARPLSSGISDENYWAMYVARMRRQPGSGISPDDAVAILRFLHYYSLEQVRKKDSASSRSDALRRARPRFAECGASTRPITSSGSS